MIKKRPFPLRILSFALALSAVCAQGARAQQLISVLPVEPPSSLFSTRIGDQDVEVFAQGFWEASALTSGTWSVGSSASGFNAVPFLFTQTPDLYAFLRFRQKWIFETYVTQDAANSMFLLAFEGGDGDLVRSARLGNSGITMPAYPYMAFGSPKGSFGMALSAYDPQRSVSIDAMVRWDGLDWKTRTFFGSSEVDETAIAPRDNVRGRRFVLGDTNIASLELTDTTAAGTRTLRSDEYSVSLATGVVLLNAEPKGSLEASWSGSGGPKSDTLYTITVNTDGTIVRATSVYEARNLYALPDTSSARQLFVRSLATGTTDTAYMVSRVAAGLVQVVKNDAVPSSAPEYMTPFISDSPWIYDDSTTSSYVAGDGYAIIARVVESADTIMLDDGTVAGTISVYRDGVESPSFTYDETSRTLALKPPPRSGESVQVRYAVASSDRSDGALAFGVGTRFPWLGLDWATAIGGRWPMFGPGYDEAGSLRSAWAGVSASVEKKTDAASFSVQTMARYQRAGAYGRYRVAGMEDSGTTSSGTLTWLTPFRPVASYPGLAVGIITAEDLVTVFPNPLSEFHSNGAANKALQFAASTATTSARFLRYIDNAPLASFKRLVFYIKVDSVTTASTITVRVGDGTVGASVTLPLDITLNGAGWRRIELDMNQAAPVVRCVAPDGSSVAIAGAAGSFSIPDVAGVAEIILTNFTEGTVQIDELLLDGAADGFSVLAGGTASLGDATRKQGLYVMLTAAGTVDDNPALASAAEAGWSGTAVSASVSASPAYASGVGSLGLGYSVALPSASAPTHIADQFSRDEALHRYARSLDASAVAGPLQVGASAMSAEEAMVFTQSWKARASVGGYLSLTGAASLYAPVSVMDESGIPDSWLRSWSLAMPAQESQASTRRLEANGSMLGSMLTAKVNRSYDLTSGVETSAEATATVPFRIGLVTLSPFYTRRTTLDRASSAASFGDDLSELAADINAAAGLWSTMPLVELWDSPAFPEFARLSTGATSASHEALMGMEVRRPIGYGVIDMLAPSAARVTFTRALQQTDDSLVESDALAMTLSGAAANVFCVGGAMPTFRTITFDEYSSKTDLAFQYYPSDGAILPSVAYNGAANLEFASGSALVATSSISWAVARDSAPWSGSAGLSMLTKPSRTWLGDLMALVTKPSAAAESTDEASAKSWVSAWLDTTFSLPPKLKNSFEIKATIARTAAVDAPLTERISFDYGTKVIAGDALTIGAAAGLAQSAAVYDSSILWGFGYQFSVEARIVF
ncbi:MAG TPA: hypothetical protein VMX33_02240 [bacterium]|nr:hypothetical protein [bacterium]